MLACGLMLLGCGAKESLLAERGADASGAGDASGVTVTCQVAETSTLGSGDAARADAIAVDNGEILALWATEDQRVLTRFDSLGQATDAEPRFSSVDSIRAPVLATSDGDQLVLFENFSFEDAPRIFFFDVDVHGRVRTSAVDRISSPGRDAHSPHLIAAGDGYLAAWIEVTELVVARIDTEGNLVRRAALPTSDSAPEALGVVRLGSGIGVWLGLSDGTVALERFSEALAHIGPGAELPSVGLFGGAGPSGGSGIATHGGSVAATVWIQDDELRLATVDEQGELRSVAGWEADLLADADARTLAVAPTPIGTGVAWIDPERVLRFAFIDAAGNVSQIAVSEPGSQATHVQLERLDAGWFAVWSQRTPVSEAKASLLRCD